MTKLFLSVLIWGMCFPTPAKLKVIVRDIEVGKGSVVLAVYDNPNNFLKKAVVEQRAKAGNQSLEFSFDLPEGNYATAIYQDLNDNKKFDKGWFGIPTEPYGLSNNFRPKFSAPGFEDCKFKITQLTTTTIHLK